MFTIGVVGDMRCFSVRGFKLITVAKSQPASAPAGAACTSCVPYSGSIAKIRQMTDIQNQPVLDFRPIRSVSNNVMRVVTLTLLALMVLPCLAGDARVITASSPEHRVALLELYTSEGCSSCPPADLFLSALKSSSLTDQQLIPIAFHVTYWDYLGWQDRYADRIHDQRQRTQVKLDSSRTVYTPQFMLNGSDYRRLHRLADDIQRINAQAAPYQLDLNVTLNADTLSTRLESKRLTDSGDKAVVYLVLYEHDLSSDITAGENEDKELYHDYVVRELQGPFLIENDRQAFKIEFARNAYRLENSGIVAFIQKSGTSEVLQAVKLRLMR